MMMIDIIRAEKRSVYLNDAKLERYLREFFATFTMVIFAHKIQYGRNIVPKAHGTGTLQNF